MAAQHSTAALLRISSRPEIDSYLPGLEINENCLRIAAGTASGHRSQRPSRSWSSNRGMRSADESVARGLQTLGDAFYLGFARVGDRGYVIDGSAGNPQFVPQERNDIAAGDRAAL
jgi:hypothetical protein